MRVIGSQAVCGSSSSHVHLAYRLIECQQYRVFSSIGGTDVLRTHLKNPLETVHTKRNFTMTRVSEAEKLAVQAGTIRTSYPPEACSRAQGEQPTVQYSGKLAFYSGTLYRLRLPRTFPLMSLKDQARNRRSVQYRFELLYSRTKVPERQKSTGLGRGLNT